MLWESGTRHPLLCKTQPTLVVLGLEALEEIGKELHGLLIYDVLEFLSREGCGGQPNRRSDSTV